MKNKTSQSGSMHLIVIIILVVVLLGALGFVFWQNFLNSSTTKTTSQSSNETETSPIADDTALTQTATATYGETNMSLKYPKSWTLASDTNTLTSADGKVILSFTLTPPDGIGGTCGGDEDQTTVSDPIVSAKWAAISGAPKAIFSAYISHVKPTSSSSDDFYTYSFAAVRNTDEIKNIKEGDSRCAPFIFANYINLDVVSGAMMHVVVQFTDLEKDNSTPYDLTSMRSDLTPDEIKTEFESANAKVAESIIESIIVK